MAQNIALILLMSLSTQMAATSAFLFPIKRFLDDALTTPPPDTPSPPPRPDCITDSGRRLQPGESWTENCQYCSCDWSSGLTCYYGDCLPAMCVDAVRTTGGCPCWECPHGNNCKIQATGEVIPSGMKMIRNEMECSCPPQSYYLPGTWEEQNYIAHCVPVIPPPTTLPPSAT